MKGGDHWKLKQGVELNLEDVAKIACALKSLSVYAAVACEEDDNPKELEETVQEGLAAIDRIFDY
jgi:hypothetical protein